MSETAPEAPARGKKENVFTRKIGPMPMWAWVAIVAAVIIGYAYYKNKNAASTTAASTTDASQVPQFVNQTYVSPVPPSSSPPPASGSPPPVVSNPGGPNRGPGPVQKGAPSTRTEKLRYKGNLEQIAKRNHIDMEDLLEANPGLAKYKGTRHVFPVGTVVKIPPASS